MKTLSSQINRHADPTIERIYSNSGNSPLIELLEGGPHRLLDIGCGAGDTAALAKTRSPGSNIFGITHSAAEAKLARRHMTECWVFDIEQPLPTFMMEQSFDVLLFSHVLEHLRNPATVLARFSHLLRSGGQLLIAVPNVLFWRTRLQFLRGQFDYTETGTLDETHLRFFTYHTADHFLLSNTPGFRVTRKVGHGSVPLWWLRRYLLPSSLARRIDQFGYRSWPNLFGSQILITAVKT